VELDVEGVAETIDDLTEIVAYCIEGALMRAGILNEIFSMQDALRIVSFLIDPKKA
jgi:hypothetical protein